MHIYTNRNYAGFFIENAFFAANGNLTLEMHLGRYIFCCTIQTHMSAHRSDQMHTPVALTHFFAAPTIL
jgi:hypothetical protein